MARNYYINREVIDYYVCVSLYLCALNAVKHVAYPYARKYARQYCKYGGFTVPLYMSNNTRLTDNTTEYNFEIGTTITSRQINHLDHLIAQIKTLILI